MFNRLGLLGLLFCVALLTACTGFRQNRRAERSPVALMTGSFTSAAQAALDSDYHAVTLHMTPIWRKSSPRGVTYLYVEQALASRPEEPYQQRVYKVEELEPDHWASGIYELPDPKVYIGKWAEPAAFDAIKPADLRERAGCTVYLEREANDSWTGTTPGNECPSNLSGATYATSQVRITPTSIESWDQGFNAKGKQVWGAEKGGYVFERM